MEGFVQKIHNTPIIRPIIAITEVGHLNSSTTLDCGMAIDDTSRRPILKIFSHHGGTVEEEDTSKKDIGKKYLILRNKKTQKVSIFGAKVTYFKKPDYFKLKTFEENNLSKDKDQEFNVTFGTKRSSRMSKAKSKEAVTATETIFDNISSFESLDNSYSPSTEFLLYLPLGCNRFTNKLENAYPISTLLHEEEISSMKNYAQEVLSMIPVSVDNEDLSQFYIASINRLSHKSIQNICLLMFADGLIELLKLRSADLNYVRNLDIYPNCVIINDKVLDNFIEYTSTGPDLTSKMKDKALCHIIIIMILSNMNVLDLSWITPFISMNCQKRLIVLMRIVGASPLKEDKYKYTLKIPLASLPQLNKKLKHSKRPR